MTVWLNEIDYCSKIFQCKWHWNMFGFLKGSEPPNVFARNFIDWRYFPTILGKGMNHYCGINPVSACHWGGQPKWIFTLLGLSYSRQLRLSGFHVLQHWSLSICHWKKPMMQADKCCGSVICRQSHGPDRKVITLFSIRVWRQRRGRNGRPQGQVPTHRCVHKRLHAEGRRFPSTGFFLCNVSNIMCISHHAKEQWRVLTSLLLH